MPICFPARGSQPIGVAYKSIQGQPDEFSDYIAKHEVIVQRLWLDVEPTCDECNAWQEGKKNNLALAIIGSSLARFWTEKGN